MVTRTVLSLLLAAAFTFAASAGSAQSRLDVHAVASQGSAAPGNNAFADFLVIVSDLQTGAPVTDLGPRGINLTIAQIRPPGQECFWEVHRFQGFPSGAYVLQVLLHPPAPGIICTWVPGDYLAGIFVNAGQDRGATAVKLSIREAEGRAPGRRERESHSRDDDSHSGERDSYWRGRGSH